MEDLVSTRRRHRRRMRMVTAVVAAAVVAVLAGAVLLVRGATVLAVPTDPAITVDRTAVFQAHTPATVRAVRHGGLVCFFGADGPADRLVFPAGFSAGPDLTLHDDRGAVVATPGFAVGIAYSDAAVTTPAACGSRGRARAVVRIASLGD